MIFSDKLKATLGFSAAVLAAFGLTFQTYMRHEAEMGRERARTALAKTREDISDEVRKLAEQTLKVQQTLEQMASTSRKVRDEEVRSLTAQRDGLLQRVRVAEASAARRLLQAASAASSPGRAPEGSDGAEVLGSLGTADVEEALRADIIRTHLLACYRDYGAARKALMGDAQ